MSRRAFRLLVLDIDGTLLTSEKKISARSYYLDGVAVALDSGFRTA